MTPPIKHFYPQATQLPYFHATNETLVERQLIQQFLADLLFKQSSFNAFCDGYNYLNSSSINERFKLNTKRFISIFFTYELNKFHFEHNLGALQSIFIYFQSKYKTVFIKILF